MAPNVKLFSLNSVPRLLLREQQARDIQQAVQAWVAMILQIRNFFECESGATAIEYALIVAIVSVSIVTSLTNARSELVNAFNSVVSGFQNSGTN